MTFGEFTRGSLVLKRYPLVYGYLSRKALGLSHTERISSRMQVGSLI